MQRLRTTFTRSRTPTGAEMKTQSSLEVPKQVGLNVVYAKKKERKTATNEYVSTRKIIYNLHMNDL